MFALWYLSLALDELRKYLGWTSIFDIFTKNKAASNKAVDNKTTNLTQSESRETSGLPKKPKVPEFQPQLPSKPVRPHNVEPAMPTGPAPVQPKPSNVQKKEVGPPKPEPSKFEPPKVEPPKPEPPKGEIPKAEPNKVELPKVMPPQPLTPIDPPTNSAFAANTQFATNKGENVDQKLFSSTPKGFENGDHFTDLTKPNTNVKDATSSFLEGEGGATSANQPKREKRNALCR